jgi:hypothetical protein
MAIQDRVSRIALMGDGMMMILSSDTVAVRQLLD